MKEEPLMKQPAEIILYLQSVEDIFLKKAGPLYCDRLLNSITEEFILDEAAKLPRHRPLGFTVHVPGHELARAGEVVAAIQKHFGYCRKKSQGKLKNTLRAGWRRLLIGFVFLVITYFLVQALSRYYSAGGFAITIRELLIILAWVALWRPAELLLYEWYPFMRDANLFRRLEHSTVKVIITLPN